LKEEKYNEILEELNTKHNDDLIDEEIFVCGIRLFLQSEDEEDEMEQTFISECGTEFTRKGFKNISYGRWTDSTWFDWE
jgi:hypothetical protein